MSDVIAGVRLPIFKARLFHFIRSHPGQSSLDLGQHFEKEANNIKVHIYQINDALMNTRFQIRGGKFAGYYIEKTRSAE
jgi:hypothetical protein